MQTSELIIIRIVFTQQALLSQYCNTNRPPTYLHVQTFVVSSGNIDRLHSKYSYSTSLGLCLIFVEARVTHFSHSPIFPLPVLVFILLPAGDYTLQRSQITFDPGEQQKTVSVLINDDVEFDPLEEFSLYISVDPSDQLGGATEVLNSPVTAVIACESKLSVGSSELIRMQT